MIISNDNFLLFGYIKITRKYTMFYQISFFIMLYLFLFISFLLPLLPLCIHSFSKFKNRTWIDAIFNSNACVGVPCSSFLSPFSLYITLSIRMLFPNFDLLFLKYWKTKWTFVGCMQQKKQERFHALAETLLKTMECSGLTLHKL